MLYIMLAKKHLRFGWGMVMLAILVLLSTQEYILYYWIAPWLYKDYLPSYWSLDAFNWLMFGVTALVMILIIPGIGLRFNPQRKQ